MNDRSAFFQLLQDIDLVECSRPDIAERLRVSVVALVEELDGAGNWRTQQAKAVEVMHSIRVRNERREMFRSGRNE
jgi:hypothetical protein